MKFVLNRKKQNHDSTVDAVVLIQAFAKNWNALNALN